VLLARLFAIPVAAALSIRTSFSGGQRNVIGIARGCALAAAEIYLADDRCRRWTLSDGWGAGVELLAAIAARVH